MREIRAILAGIPHDIVSLDALPAIDAPEETGRTFEENARAKALHYAAATGELTVAEDSGLEIDALGGAPGVESARYGGVDSTARFVCALALASGQCGADISDARRILFETRASVEGRIAAAPRGRGGFGYDPIFFYPPYGCTLAEATPEQKAAVSHRGQAFRTLRRCLEVSASEQPASHARDVR